MRRAVLLALLAAAHASTPGVRAQTDVLGSAHPLAAAERLSRAIALGPQPRLNE